MKLAYSYLLKEKKKSIIIILTIMLMVIAMVCIGNMIYGLRNCQTEYIKSNNGYYEYRFDVNNDNLGHIVQSDQYQVGILQYICNTEKPVPIQLMACDANFLKMNRIALKEGAMPANSNEVVVEEWVLNNLGADVKIGTNITFQNNNYTISGILTDSFYKTSKQMNMYTTFLTEQDSEVYIQFKDKQNMSHQMTKLADEYKIKKDTIAANWNVLESEGTKAPTGEANNNLLGYLKRISVNEYDITIVWCILSVLMIYSLYYLSIFKREKDYGILRALGCSKSRLFGIMIEELLILFIIGTVPGYYIGKWITVRIYDEIMNLFLASDITIVGVQENSNIFILGCTVIIILLCLIALIMSRKIAGATSTELIKKKEGALLKKRKILSMRKTNLKYSIAYRYITIRKSLLILLVLSLSVGNILFVVAQYALEQLKEQKILEVQSESGFGADYKICIENTDLHSGITEKNLSTFQNVKGIDKTFAFRYTMGAVQLNTNQYPNKNYFEPENENKRLQDMTGGICTEEKDGSYLLRSNIWGYDKESIDCLKGFLVDGEINSEDIINNNKAVVRLSMSGTGEFDNVKIKPGDILSIQIPRIEYYDQSDIWKYEKADYYNTIKVEVAATIKDIPTKNEYFIGSSVLI